MLICFKTPYLKTHTMKKKAKFNWHPYYLWYPKIFVKTDLSTSFYFLWFEKVERIKKYNDGDSWYDYRFIDHQDDIIYVDTFFNFFLNKYF